MKQSNSYRDKKENNSDNFNKIDDMFESLRNENTESSFSDVEKWLRKINVQKSFNKSSNHERKFFNMKSPKIKFAYAFLILAFVVAACNYPVTQQEPVADVIKWTIDQNDTKAIDKINSLVWTKSANVSVKEVDNGNSIAEYRLVVSKEDHANTQNYLDQLKSIEGIVTVNLVPLNEEITRPIYSLALNEIFKIDINATNMSDEELKNQITSQLEQNDVKGVQISFEKTEDGRRVSRIFIPEEAIKNTKGFDLTIQEGDENHKSMEVRKFRNNDDGEVDKFKGKSDEEIKKMLAEELKDKNINPEDINVIRKDGKVMINISKKKDGSETEDEFQFEGEVGN
ncbi:MAG: hypothetical protein WAT71_12970 [Ignavibacteria bacterium]